MADTKKYNRKIPTFLTNDGAHVTRHKHDTTWDETLAIVGVNGDPTVAGDGVDATGREWLNLAFINMTVGGGVFNAIVWGYVNASTDDEWVKLYDAFGDQITFAGINAAVGFGPIHIGAWDRIYVEVDTWSITQTDMLIRLT